MDQPAAQTPTTDSGEEAAALADVEHHHAVMLKRLAALTGALSQAVRSGDAVAEHDAHDVLVEWCETELLPHALAEERLLYIGARSLPEGRLLVEAMVAELQAVAGLVEELRGTTGVDAAVAAGSLRSVFALHVGQGNRLLLPLIVAAAGQSLARTVEGLPELVGETRARQHGTGSGGSV